MKAAVYNLKGGVGKTRIAAAIALSLKWGIVTNDAYSIIHEVFPEEKCLILEKDDEMPEFPDHFDLVFDLGGYADHRAVSALKQSDIVIVPTANCRDEIITTLESIAEIQRINPNVIVVANKIQGEDYQDISKVINKKMDIPIFPLKYSKSLANILDHKKSIKELVEEGGLRQYLYTAVNDQIEAIIEYIVRPQT